MPKQLVRVTRRSLIKRAAAFVTAPYVVPAGVWGDQGRIAPSGRITLGFIGVGMMGRGHLRGLSYYPEAQIVAVCDVDRWRREDAKRMVEEEYASQRCREGYRGCRAYNDLRELLARDDIDAVVIATGDRWHALATSLAAKAGKDIYCEKPISLTIREARAMVDVTRRYGRVFQTGLQQRSAPEFIRACRLVRDGAIGKVKVVYVAFPGTVGDVSLPAEPVPDGLDWNHLSWLRGVSEGRMVRLRLNRREPLRVELEAFVAASRGEAVEIVRGEDGLIALELAQTLIRSGQEHRAIVIKA